MFKFVVLLACAVAVTVAEQGHLGNAYGSALGYGYGYGGQGYGTIPAAYGLNQGYGYGGYGQQWPAAVSHQSSVVYHNQPISSYTTPHLSYGANYNGASPISNGLYGNSYNGLGGYGLGYGSNYGYGNVYGYGNGYGYGNNYLRSHY